MFNVKIGELNYNFLNGKIYTNEQLGNAIRDEIERLKNIKWESQFAKENVPKLIKAYENYIINLCGDLK